MWRIGNNVAFVRLLIIKGYWEGLNSHPSQKTKNENLPINDVMILDWLILTLLGMLATQMATTLGAQRYHYLTKSHKKNWPISCQFLIGSIKFLIFVYNKCMHVFMLS
jgi:hypothetical protein